MKFTDTKALKKQLQLFAWYGNDSIALIDASAKDNVCKVIKVLDLPKPGETKEE